MIGRWFISFFRGNPSSSSSSATVVAKPNVLKNHLLPAQDDGKASIKGYADFDDNSPQHCDSYTVGMESQDSEDIILSNKTSTVPKASSLETPCEHIVKAGNAVLCKSVTREFDGPGLKMSPVIRNDVDSSTESKRLGLSSRRMTRSMAKHCDIVDVNDDIVLIICKRKQKEGKFSSRADVPDKEGVDARNIINSRKTIMTQSKSQSKLTSGRSSRSSKGSKDLIVYGSANILPLESFGGKKSRSGRVLLPTLEFWRNQKLVYDEVHKYGICRKKGM